MEYTENCQNSAENLQDKPIYKKYAKFLIYKCFSLNSAAFYTSLKASKEGIYTEVNIKKIFTLGSSDGVGQTYPDGQP